MTKDNILFSVIGLLLGLIVGFAFANTVNQRGYERRAAEQQPAIASSTGNPAQGAGAPSQNASQVPGNHPPVPANGVADQSRMPPEIQITIQKAKDEPNNFEAQMKAAQLYYQIKRFGEAVTYYSRANQIRPESYEAVIALGNVNFDAENYDAAEKWYTAALAKRPDDVNARTDLGLVFVYRQPEDYDRAIKEFRRSLEINPRHEQTLQNITFALAQKGQRDEAQAALKKLAEVNPQNKQLENLRAQIDKPGNSAQQ